MLTLCTRIRTGWTQRRAPVQYLHVSLIFNPGLAMPLLPCCGPCLAVHCSRDSGASNLLHLKFHSRVSQNPGNTCCRTQGLRAQPGRLDGWSQAPSIKWWSLQVFSPAMRARLHRRPAGCRQVLVLRGAWPVGSPRVLTFASGRTAGTTGSLVVWGSQAGCCSFLLSLPRTAQPRALATAIPSCCLCQMTLSGRHWQMVSSLAVPAMEPEQTQAMRRAPDASLGAFCSPEQACCSPKTHMLHTCLPACNMWV